MRYRREKVKQAVVTFSPKDADLYEWLSTQPGKAGTIKRLLREEMTSGEQRGRRGAVGHERGVSEHVDRIWDKAHG